MSVLAQISRAFTYRDRKIWMGLYKTYVRPHLEFAVQAWSPWSCSDIDCLERIQEKAVKQVSGLVGKTYEERLTELGIESLEKRRMRLDLIETFKILRGHEDVEPSTWFKLVPQERTRLTRMSADGLCLQRVQTRLDLRRNFFSSRVVEPWNRLPEQTRRSPNVSSFKTAISKL